VEAKMTSKHTHYCDTYNPTRPCCWAARSAELAVLAAAGEARKAKYGRTSCPDCGKVYRVTDGVVEDHAAVCKPLTDSQIWS